MCPYFLIFSLVITLLHSKEKPGRNCIYWCFFFCKIRHFQKGLRAIFRQRRAIQILFLHYKPCPLTSLSVFLQHISLETLRTFDWFINCHKQQGARTYPIFLAHRTVPYRNRPSIVRKNTAKSPKNAIFYQTVWRF